MELLDGARQILTFGAGGSSTMLTQQLQFRLVRLGYAISAVDAAVGADQNTTVKAQWVAAWLRAADLERELRRTDSELLRRTTRSMELRRQVS